MSSALIHVESPFLSTQTCSSRRRYACGYNAVLMTTAEQLDDAPSFSQFLVATEVVILLTSDTASLRYTYAFCTYVTVI